MFTTKKDVDKHVRTGFAKLRTENEKSLRSYAVAKLYERIGEHHSALHYVSAYLGVRDDSAQAHRLAGQCHERLKRPDKAIAAYQRSMQLDPKQSDLLIDVCKLLLAAGADDSALSKPGTLRFWCDLADAQRVQHEAVVNLRMKLLRRDTFTPQQVDELLQREIAAQPHSVALRIQLVRHMLDQRRLDEAFKYANELEQRQLEHFAHSLDWYTSVAQVIAQLEHRDCTHSWPYWLLAVTTAERQLFLTLSAADRRTYAPAAQLLECATHLHHLDQTLDRAAKASPALAPSADVAAAFVAHFRGQLCLHAATLVYRREQLQKTHWRETQRAALPLLLLALSEPPAQLARNVNHTEPVRALLRQWQREGAFRSVQAGRTLLAHVDESKAQCTVMANIRKICTADKTGLSTSNAELLAQIRQYCADADWRRTVFRTLFNGLGQEQLDQHSGSYLVQAPELAEPRYELPAVEDLQAHAETAQWLRPSALALQVYLAVGGATAGVPATLADFRCAVFDGLHVTTPNLVNCGAETLSQLDVDAVLLATAVQTQLRLSGERSHEQPGSATATGSTSAVPPVAVQRPFANIAAQLATEEQAAWWTAAYRVYKNISTPDLDLAEVRATIQHGLEAVRGVGTPKMDLMICLRLGHIFAARATIAAKPSDRQPLDGRADALFKFALHMVRMRANGSLGESWPMFRYQATGVGAFEAECAVNAAAEEAVTYVASRYFQSQSYQECIEELAGIQLPFATYFVAEAYRKLEQSAAATTPRKSRRVYVEKARDSLQQTLELLDYPHVDKNHALRAIVHDDLRAVQQQLSKAHAVSSELSFTNGGGNAEEYLNDSVSSLGGGGGGGRSRRQTPSAASADISAPRVDELKLLMTKMMEQLTLVQDDMMAVRTRLGNIEEQLNRKPDPPTHATPASTASISAAHNPLEDYFLEDELNQQQAFANANPYGPFVTPRHGAPHPGMMPNAAAAAAMMSGVPLSAYGAPMSQAQQQQQQQQQYFNTMYQQMGYQAALSGGRNPMLPPVGPSPQHGYMDPMGGAYGMTPPTQNSNILGLLQPPPMPFTPPQMQQQQQSPMPSVQAHLQQPPPPVHQYQQPPLVMPNQPPPTTTITPSQQQQHQQPQPQQQQQLPAVKPWNPALNNAPVEKTPPVNVVITSSDPLPLLTSKATTVASAAAQPTMSVTIPSHHIKNNSSTDPAAAVPSISTSTATTPIFGGFVKTPSSLTKSVASTPPPAATKKTEDKPKSNVFGALNFSTPKEDKTAPKSAAAEPNAAPAKPSPFANFSFGTVGGGSPAATNTAFGSISTGTNAFNAFGASKTTPSTTAVAPVVTSTSTATTTTFAGSGLFSSLTATKGLASAPKLSTSPIKAADLSSYTAANADGGNVAEGGAEAEDDYVPTAHFEPVIALPDLVETKTGEEEEHIRFEHRAKLLRYVKETKEWKERGIGQMKVLVNKKDPSKVRLLMRREQVLKLCCNQLLAADTKFNALGAAGTSMTWCGQDYSENELQVELLAIRFKTADTCAQFHAAVLEAQRNMGDSSSSAEATSTGAAVEQAKTTAAAASAPKASASSGFGDKFKAASGSWDCTGCYVSNKAASTKCVACNSPAPGASKPADEAPKASTSGGFGDKFKSASGSWDCTGCYVTNTATSTKCVACNGPAPGGASKPAATVPPSTASAPPPVAAGTGFGGLFKPKSGSWECKACYISNKPDVVHCMACEAPKDDTVAPKPKTHALLATSADAPKFSFGVPMAAGNSAASAAPATFAAPATSTSATAAAGSGAFSFGTFTAMTSTTGNNPVFGTPQFGFSINGPAAPSSASTSVKPQLSVDVKLEPKEAFSFVFKPKSPTKLKSPQKNYAEGTEDVSDDENIEEENNTYFTPVIALPDKVDVVTGEENEVVLYTHRAKLYKFTDSEWKERGLGDVKILRHQQTGKLRVVMRRDQVHKICLNHALTDDIEYKTKDEKSWHFVANDYTEGAVELLQFCLRFKTADIAIAFKTAADDALSGKLTAPADGDGPAAGVAASAAATNVSDEDKRLAEQLKLSIAFFGYREAPACAGCRGCRSDEFVFPDYSAVNTEHLDTDPLPLTMPIRSPTGTSAADISQSLVKQSSFSFATPVKPSAAAASATPTLFGSNAGASGGSMFGSQSTFSSPAVGKSASVFGDAKPIGASIFGSNATAAAASTVFGGVAETSVASSPAPKPLPTKSFSFGSPFGGPSPFQVSAITSTAASTGSVTPTTQSANATSTFSFKLPASTEQVEVSNEPSAAKPFSFSMAMNAATNSKTDSASTTTSTSDAAPLSIFGGTANKTSTTPNSSSTTTTTTSDAAPASIFGGAAVFKSAEKIIGASDNTTNAAPPTTNIFGSSTGGIVFGGFGKTAPSNSSAVDPTAAVPFKDTGISFASLATSTQASTAAPSTGGFFGLSNKDNFTSFQRTTEENGAAGGGGSGGGDEATGGEDPNYDPHYDPIIALPDEIVVKTGEEDEEKIFGERAKLFRYDTTNREWKERGIGELKILYHVAKGTYRILLRREQIFKLVLNHALTTDVLITPMQSSDKAYCWATNNYAEEGAGVAEQLSVRFKNSEIGGRFDEAIKQCMAQLRLRPQAD